MDDTAKSVQFTVIEKVVEVIGSKDVRWKVVGGLDISKKVVVDVLSLLVCCICCSNDVRQVFDSLETSRNCIKSVTL